MNGIWCQKHNTELLNS